MKTWIRTWGCLQLQLGNMTSALCSRLQFLCHWNCSLLGAECPRPWWKFLESSRRHPKMRRGHSPKVTENSFSKLETIKIRGKIILNLQLYNYNWLVVWNMKFMIFHSVGNFIIPTDEVHHFSEGLVETTNQIWYTIFITNIAYIAIENHYL